ncbi:MAG: carbohydrate kinase [Saprospiraceae bacterium]
MSNHSIISFGEVLWDLLPSGKIAGGAPMNVAFHAKTFGLQTNLISRVGADEPGRELLAFLTKKGIPTGLVQIDHTFPTGIVNVTLDAKGSPSYEIVQPVAWDYIHPTEEAKKAVSAADALVFGSLACRTNRTKNTLLELLEFAPLRVFDVNLRPPFFSKELLEELLPKANLAKMNDDELDTIAGWHNVSSSDAVKMDFIKKHYGLDSLLVTLGAKGAKFQNDQGLFSQTGFKVKVQDTIGSGDAFLGAFLSKFLIGASPSECLETACAAGAFVATKKGATPEYSPTEIFQNFIQA